ncbi:putative bromodomain containing protein [Erysiphe necator]|uniref:Putative bromodomain containing protein n=1 Tax=Uncinula necator TaxID=52586 RepID=A0A0B1P1Q6_UNCNE|nr:putative bromodomain containing protein [Erysiphe necator]
MSKRISGAGLVAEEFDERAVKRRKLPLDGKDETAEIITQHGLELLDVIKRTSDKNGRLIATDFLTLPNKRLLPEYYQVIKMPIALDTIENKLKRGEIQSLAILEGYFKRMVLNAKEFNARGSLIYEDSERLRKVINNYMMKYNSAHKTTSGLAPLPISLPAEDNKPIDLKSPQRLNSEEPAMKKSIRISRSSQNSKSTTNSILPEPHDNEQSFEGLSFQQAQEKIVDDMISQKEQENDDFGAFEPFINLPSRKEYKDYYSVINYPLALRDLQKAVKGIRSKTPGVSEFKTWAAFEEEAAFIWKNAFQYNEDNSDIFKLALDLQKFFRKSLQKAKSAVTEPASTKIKLRMPEPTKITLKISKKSSPTETIASQSVQSALGSQSFSNGTASRNQINVSMNTLSVSRPDSDESLSKSVLSSTNPILVPVKNEHGSSTSPNLQNSSSSISTSTTPVDIPQPTSVPTSELKSSSMNASTAVPKNAASNVTTETSTASKTVITTASTIAPTTTASTTSTNLSSTIQKNALSYGGYMQTLVNQSPSTMLFNSKFRLPGKTASDAMITNLSIATHPGLNIIRHFHMDLPPSTTLAQQSVTINLPATHYYLQIKPSIALSMMQRQHKLFVTAGTTRLHAMPTIPGHPVEPRNPLFEARLHPGVNRIEIEIIAAFPKGTISTREVEVEKINLYVNLMKA